MPTDIAEIKSSLCDDLQKLITHVEKSSPGFEYVGQEKILVRINRAAQQLGVPFICMDARVDGHRRSERFVVLRFPDSEQSYKICRHSNDAPDITFPRTPEECLAALKEMHKVNVCEYDALYNQKADRHITTSQERGLILTHLNAWLGWANPNHFHIETHAGEQCHVRAMPNLQKYDRQAYQLWSAGKKQGEIANLLNREYGTQYRQGQVSRMIDRAKTHAKASGLDALISKPAEKARAVDPELLELGKRVDGRTKRQRPELKD